MFHRINCNEASDIELTLSVEDRKAQNKTGMSPVPWRKIRWERKKKDLEHFDMVWGLVVLVEVGTVSS